MKGLSVGTSKGLPFHKRGTRVDMSRKPRLTKAEMVAKINANLSRNKGSASWNFSKRTPA